MINDNSRPVIFLGHNSALFMLTDICKQHGIDIAGIIDSDYFGNTAELDGVSVIDTELVFEDPSRLEYYKNNFNFFVATNTVSNQDATTKRNNEKRKHLIDVIERYELPCITLIDNRAHVHESNQIGKGIFIDAFCYIAPKNILGDFGQYWAACMISHDNKIGRNVTWQRHSGIMSYNTVGDDVYVGLHSQIPADKVTIASGTTIHPCMALKRSTQPNELISLAGKDLRRTYHYYTIEE